MRGRKAWRGGRRWVAAAWVILLVGVSASAVGETLAEGIEEHDQLGQLQIEGCDSGQGFLFARPLAVDAVGQFLDTWVSAPDAALVIGSESSLVG